VRTLKGTLDWGRAQLGYNETPVNRTKYAAMAGHANGQAWCATFQVAWSKAVGQPLPRGANSAYTPTMAQAFQDAGRWGKAPKRGALGFIRYAHLGRIGHVFRVEDVEVIDGVTWVITIEGNTNSGGSRTGGGVARLRRRASEAVGYGYLDHAKPKPPKKPKPKKLKTSRWTRRRVKAITGRKTWRGARQSLRASLGLAPKGAFTVEVVDALRTKMRMPKGASRRKVRAQWRRRLSKGHLW